MKQRLVSQFVNACELAGLQRQDVDLLRSVVHVRRALKDVNGHLTLGPTKTHAQRTVSLPKPIADMLTGHLAGVPLGLVLVTLVVGLVTRFIWGPSDTLASVWVWVVGIPLIIMLAWWVFGWVALPFLVTRGTLRWWNNKRNK